MYRDILLIVLTLAVLFLCVQVYFLNNSIGELWDSWGTFLLQLQYDAPGRDI